MRRTAQQLAKLTSFAANLLYGPGYRCGNTVVASRRLPFKPARGVDALVQGRAKLRSASGDLTAGIVQGSTVWVDARSMSGDTTSEMDVSDAPPESEGPTVDFRARTMSGDITVRRA